MNALAKWRLASGAVAMVAAAEWDVDRIWTSPARASSTWFTGTALGLSVGVAAGACWIVAVYRKRTDRMSWWSWASALAFVVTFATTHANPATQTQVTSAYGIGALWYDLSTYAGVVVVVAIVARRRSRGRPGGGQAPSSTVD